MKQGDMAKQLKMTQQNYSRIENSEEVSDAVLAKIAGVLDYDVDFIRQMPDAPYVYSNNQQGGNVVNYEFNPLDKIVQLYEALLANERNRVAQLESQLALAQDKLSALEGSGVKKDTGRTKER